MLDRTTAPDFVKSNTFNLIEPDRKRLSNGMDVFFIYGGSQDVLKIELLFKAGRWYESKWGVSYFTSHQLSKGTQSKSSYDIAQLFDRYGAHLEVNAGLDNVSISLYTLTRNLAPVVELLKEILQVPVFPQKELDQAKAIYLQNLKINHEKTSFLASKQFRKNLFGETHPYGKEPDEADIEALGQHDIADYFQKCFQDFTVFVSGKFDDADKKLIQDIFSSWHIVKTPEKVIEAPRLEPVHQHFEKEDSVQSSIRMGNRSLHRTHPDYVKALFVSHILGGYFGSRLMKNIREEKGLTYGIYASLHPLKQASYLVIGADVNKENIQLTFDEIRKELKRLRNENISADELETARNHFIGSLQAELTTPFAHADKLKTICQYGFPIDYYEQLIATIERILPEHIMEISAQYFHEEHFFEIAAG